MTLHVLEQEAQLSLEEALYGDETLNLPTKLPFPSGQSPFRTKGSIYLWTRRYHAAFVPGGVDAVLEALPDEASRAFYRQDFLPNGWYDYLPMALIAGAAAARADQTPVAWLRGEAERHAEHDLSGIYKLLLRFSSPEAAIRRMPRVNKQYFDFLTVEAEVSEPGAATFTTHHLPELVAPLFAFYTGAFVRRLLHLSGGSEVRSVPQTMVPEGARDGVLLVRLQVRYTWQA